MGLNVFIIFSLELFKGTYGGLKLFRYLGNKVILKTYFFEIDHIAFKPLLVNRLPGQKALINIDHSTSRYSGRGSLIKIIKFKHGEESVRKLDSLSIG